MLGPPSTKHVGGPGCGGPSPLPFPDRRAPARRSLWFRGRRAFRADRIPRVADAPEDLFRLLYAELRNLATRQLAGSRPGGTLQPTALVHEAYLKLAGDSSRWNDKQHFLATAARAMRQIIVDHARGRKAQKRGGGRGKVTLNDEIHAGIAPAEEILAVNEALALLDEIDPRQTQVVELRYFGGFSVEEVGEVMELSPATVHRLWTLARTWLRSKIDPA